MSQSIVEFGTGEDYSYAYSDPLHPHAVTSVTGTVTGTQAYSYDTRGRQRTGGGRSISYNSPYGSRDLPTTLVANGETTRFFYDAFDRRAQKCTGTRCVDYAGDLLERRYDGAASPTTPETWTFYVHAEGRVVAHVDFQPAHNGAPSREWKRALVDDHRGSIQTVATQAVGGTLSVQHLYYSPWGERVSAEGTVLASNPKPEVTRGFTEHEHDEGLGLINMRGRLYDPKLAHFLSPDPIRQDILFGQALNAYSYVWNNPLRYRDPSGFCSAEAKIANPIQCTVHELPDYVVTASAPEEKPREIAPIPDVPFAANLSMNMSLGYSDDRGSNPANFDPPPLPDSVGPTPPSSSGGHASFHHLLGDPEFKVVDTSETWERGFTVATL